MDGRMEGREGGREGGREDGMNAATTTVAAPSSSFSTIAFAELLRRVSHYWCGGQDVIEEKTYYQELHIP